MSTILENGGLEAIFIAPTIETVYLLRPVHQPKHRPVVSYVGKSLIYVDKQRKQQRYFNES